MHEQVALWRAFITDEGVRTSSSRSPTPAFPRFNAGPALLAYSSAGRSVTLPARLVSLALVVAATVVTYRPTLGNGFLQVGFDDAIILDTVPSAN